MAETAVGYFPDVPLAWDFTPAEDHLTAVQTAWGGREQRRAQYPTTGYRRFAASSMSLEQTPRRIVKRFLHDKRGRLIAFNFWNPEPQEFFDVAAGSVTAQARIVIPYRMTGPFGNVTSGGSLNDVRVAGISQTGYAIHHLNPSRQFSFASLLTNGTTGYVDCGSSSSLRSNTNMAVSLWVYVVALQTNPWVTNETFNASGFAFMGLASGNVLFRTNQAGANTAATWTGAISAGVWTHFVVSRSGTNVTLYKNGVLVSTIGSIADSVTATIPFTISQQGTVHDGMISNVRYYNAAVSAGDAAVLYAEGQRALLPAEQVQLLGGAALKGWWQLEEGTGIVAADSSGTGNTGTLQTGTSWVAGEELVIFSGNKTGAVTVSGILRDRMVARSNSDVIGNRFLPSADVRGIYDIRIKEVA